MGETINPRSTIEPARDTRNAAEIFRNLREQDLVDLFNTDEAVRKKLSEMGILEPVITKENLPAILARLEKIGDGRYYAFSEEKNETDKNGKTVENSLNTGGAGRFRLCLDTQLAKICLSKRIQQKWLEDKTRVDRYKNRFKREARNLGRANTHPFIVDIYDLQKDKDGNDVIIMEYVEGEDMFEYLKNNKTLDGKQRTNLAATFGMQACDALAHLHTTVGILHRDLKPENFIRTPVGAPKENEVVYKLLDFGTAKKISKLEATLDKDKTNAEEESAMQGAGTKEEAEEDRRMTTPPHMIVGTANYIAPEEIESAVSAQESPWFAHLINKPTDPRSELYSLGMILYQILKGELPPASRGNDFNKVMTRRLKTNFRVTQLTNDPEVDQALAPIVDQLLERVPDKRPPDAHALKQMIKTALEQAGYTLKNDFYSSWNSPPDPDSKF